MSEVLKSQESEAQSLMPLLQALLMSSSDPLDIESLSRAADADIELVEAALSLLCTMLEKDEFGFGLVKIAKGYQFRTKSQFARFIRALKQESPKKLSPAALETLAVIAYRQPVVKHDIDRLRGVDVLPTLKTLLERGLVKVVGHRDTVGHPSLYSTTDDFLRLFGLNTLEDLPSVKELNSIQIEPGESGEGSSTNFENPLAAIIRDDQEHITASHDA